MKPVAAAAEHLAAGGVCTGADFQECVSPVFVVFDREALEEAVAGRAGCGGELFHEIIIAQR